MPSGTASPVPPRTPVPQRRLYDLNKLLSPHLFCSVLFLAPELAPVVMYAAQALADQALSFLYIIPKNVLPTPSRCQCIRQEHMEEVEQKSRAFLN